MRERTKRGEGGGMSLVRNGDLRVLQGLLGEETSTTGGRERELHEIGESGCVPRSARKKGCIPREKRERGELESSRVLVSIENKIKG